MTRYSDNKKMIKRSENPKDSFSDIPECGALYRVLPSAIKPYLTLARFDRPIGTWLVLFPCWWSLALATDNWTVETQDKKFSAQWEHTILVTKNGFQVLTQRPDESF